MRASPGMVLLTVGCEPPTGVASMRKPVMVSTLVRQFSVKEVSVTSEIRTRRGGLTSAFEEERKADIKTEQRIIGDGWKCAPSNEQPVTFQCGHLSL